MQIPDFNAGASFLVERAARAIRDFRLATFANPSTGNVAFYAQRLSDASSMATLHLWILEEDCERFRI
jgi:hypothetical protein